MNILKLIQDIEKADPEVYGRLDSRRAAFKNISGFSKKIAVAAVPLALGSLFTKAYGQSNNAIVDTLQFALTLEYLEDEFYRLGLASSTAVAAANRPVIEQISKHEAAHVKFLQDTLRSLNATPVPKPTFDFSAGGAFADWNTNPATFLALAQAFEDTGVRAYKGQAGNLIASSAVLTAALQIHSVEARHAAEIRKIRGLKSWITGNERGAGMPAPTQAVYNGEEVTTQATVNIASGGISVGAASEAFDEPLEKQAVLDIANLFIVQPR
ncbi:ferritin-like domain-containing protein [Pontibacter arcticus]|uniref:Ferritin-like domain-containing protein n=1 Tax=Pontibacter arcticus TaxID=2080288 RepID=A0A364RHH9_9BACT|nr:ferritin-like domain-containing protein [Pontibacter arcticus]RAU83790.1 ferritin-like domain-containing protein [Pontibacter arcticus]